MKLLIFRTPKFAEAVREQIPYDENTKKWHVWLDICSVTPNDLTGCLNKALDIDTMMSTHQTDWMYYDDGTLQELIDDGYLELRYCRE